MLIGGAFDAHTLAIMQLALDRVCETAQYVESHAVRRRIAVHIVRCARHGRTTLDELTVAGQRGLPIRNDRAAS